MSYMSVQEQYPPQEWYKVVENMEKYGGSFVKALAECFRRADPFNFERLKNAFPQYWDEYATKFANREKKFVIYGKAYFYAEDIGDAFVKLAHHFDSLANDADDIDLFCIPNSEIKIEPVDENGLI